MNYDLYFMPRRLDDTNPDSPAVLVPVIINEDGESFVSNKVVLSIEKALSMDAGFSPVHFIEDIGGFEATKDQITSKDEEGPDDA